MTATSTLSSTTLDTSTARVPRRLFTHLKTEEGKKQLKYAAVSVVAIAVSQLTLITCYGLLRWDGALKTRSQLVAFVVSAIPAYFLNRLWVWGKNGRSDMWKEIMPFWLVNFVQLAVSLAFVRWAQGLVEEATTAHAIRTAGFLFNNLFIYAVMWVGKYVFFNKVLFAHKPEVQVS